MEYPKWLYLLTGEGILCQDEAEEKTAREAGFGDLVGGTPPAGKTDEPPDEREALKAKLKAAGISFGGNTGIEKLRELAKDL